MIKVIWLIICYDESDSKLDVIAWQHTLRQYLVLDIRSRNFLNVLFLFGMYFNCIHGTLYTVCRCHKERADELFYIFMQWSGLLYNEHINNRLDHHYETCSCISWFSCFFIFIMIIFPLKYLLLKTFHFSIMVVEFWIYSDMMYKK
jgi:hypothetical protein